VRPLSRKLQRDLVQMRASALTIAFVVAAGVAAFITLRGTYLVVLEARDRYYAAQRFGHVFSELERAPLAAAAQVAALPGVARAYVRVVGSARVPLASLSEPAQARVISLPERGVPALNGVQLVAGRMPRDDRDDEALLSEQFADIHRLRPGQQLELVLEGRVRAVRVVGLAMSPEFVLSMPQGAVTPAPQRFAVFWMPRRAVEAAYDMSGAFNSVVVELVPHTEPARVVRGLDQLLEHYGSRGAYTRARQASHRQLSQNLAQIGSIATLAPIIFLCVAAFLLNVSLTRVVELERSQIATLKALGYRDRELAFHYLRLGLVIALGGALLGTALGTWLAGELMGVVVRFCRMPSLAFRLSPQLAAAGLFASAGAALLGAGLSARRAMRLPPAEAMRPAAPARYVQGTLARRITRRIEPAARMVARELTRRPLRALSSVLGIAVATGLIVLGQFLSDAMKYVIDFYLLAQQRETIAVSFAKPVSIDSVRALHALPGVRDVQWRSVLPVRVRSGHRERVVGLIAHPERHSLRPLITAQAHEVALRPGQVIVTDMLATKLGARVGDALTLEPLEGDRRPRRLIISGTISELFSLFIHVRERDFARWLGVAPMATEAHLLVDEAQVERVQRALGRLPAVATAARKMLLIDEFRRGQGTVNRSFALVLSLFAATIAVAITYTNARVSLSMRTRDLASLRVLGFSRAEIARVLIGELGVQIALGIPLGLLVGRGLVSTLLATSDFEAVRFVNHIEPRAYALAVIVTLGAAIASAWLVRRKLDQLDLIEVLKLRE
jgi:putative ABC transport system permease protein